MTAPTSHSGRPRLDLGDRRGLTATGGVLVALLLGLAGGAIDLLTGSGLREGFAVGFVTGCVAAALSVHREDLMASIVMPPLLYVVLALGAGIAQGSGGSGSFLRRQALELVNALVIGAPILMAATGAALVVALVRWSAGRR